MNQTLHKEDTQAMSVENQTIVWTIVKPLVSAAATQLFLMIAHYGFIYYVSVFGVFSNIANMVIYCKMGLSESSNVNFFVLSAFDLLVAASTFSTKVLYWQGEKLELTFLTLVVSLSGSAMMTTLISTERCLYVVFPLKVKTLLSRSRSLCLTLLVVAYHVSILIFLYVEILHISYEGYPKVLGFYIASLYAVPSTTCFFIVLVTTLFLVITLRRRQRWRRETATQTEDSSSRDNKLVRTIIAISTIFIVSTLPAVVLFVIQAIYPPFRYTDPYFGGVVLIVYDFTRVLQNLSSSINIFIYYRISSKFYKVLSENFLCRKNGQKEP